MATNEPIELDDDQVQGLQGVAAGGAVPGGVQTAGGYVDAHPLSDAPSAARAGDHSWVHDLGQWAKDTVQSDKLFGGLWPDREPDPSTLSPQDRQALAAYHAERDGQPARPRAAAPYDPAAVQAAALAQANANPPEPTAQQLASIGLGSAGAGAGGGAGADFDPETTQSLQRYAELARGSAESGAEGLESQHEAAKDAAAQEASYDMGERGMAEGKRLERDARKDEAEGHWRAATEDASKARLEDPRTHLSWGQRLAMAISMAAGAFGAGLTHTQNGAAQIWSDYLNDDIERQKQAIATKRASVEDAHGAYAEMLRRTGDEEKAEILARAQGKEAFRAGLQQQLLQAQDPSIRAQGLKELAETEKSIAEEREKYDRLKPKPTGGGGGGGPTDKELRERVMALRDKAAVDGVDLPVDEARRLAIHELTGRQVGGAPEMGYAKGPRQGAAIDPRTELQAAASDIASGYGEDAYDRNAPDWARSSEALNEHTKLAVAARAMIKVIGGREPPPGRAGDEAAVKSMVGPRPDELAVKSFLARAAHLTTRGAPAPGRAVATPEDRGFRPAGQ